MINPKSIPELQTRPRLINLFELDKKVQRKVLRMREFLKTCPLQARLLFLAYNDTKASLRKIEENYSKSNRNFNQNAWNQAYGFLRNVYTNLLRSLQVQFYPLRGKFDVENIYFLRKRKKDK